MRSEEALKIAGDLSFLNSQFEEDYHYIFDFTQKQDTHDWWKQAWETLPNNQMPVTCPWEMDSTPPSSPLILEETSVSNRTMSSSPHTKSRLQTIVTAPEQQLSGSPLQIQTEQRDLWQTSPRQSTSSIITALNKSNTCFSFPLVGQPVQHGSQDQLYSELSHEPEILNQTQTQQSPSFLLPACYQTANITYSTLNHSDQEMHIQELDQ